MTIHTITAFFDSRRHAEEAVALLVASGVPAAEVSLSPNGPEADFAGFDPFDGARTPKRTGFWAKLEDLFGGSDDHDLYAEGVRRGSTMLTAHVDDDHLDATIETLDRHGSIDIDERALSWRNDGWLPGAGVTDGGVVPRIRHVETEAVAAIPVEALQPIRAGTVQSLQSSPPRAPVMTDPTVGPQVATPRQEDRDGPLQVVEERLVVGKRSVSRGKIRIHSHMVETPVTQDVSLRDETLSLDRHRVDRALEGRELEVEAFRDRTVEMEEIDEEAVVTKTARIVEEIGLRKEVTSRVETIRDTVRATRVDVEDARAVPGGGLAGDDEPHPTPTVAP